MKAMTRAEAKLIEILLNPHSADPLPNGNRDNDAIARAAAKVVEERTGPEFTERGVQLFVAYNQAQNALSAYWSEAQARGIGNICAGQEAVYRRDGGGKTVFSLFYDKVKELAEERCPLKR